MKRAFSLVELVVVLAVIAVVTHIAVHELSQVREARMAAAADRQLEALRDAVWSSGADGAPAGFLADVGRLPRRLDELWRKPEDVALFTVAEAPDGVRVPTGWRGPYLRLPFSRTRLLDPWGNDFGEVTNAAGFAVSAYHNGSSGQARTRSAELPLVPGGDGTAELTLYFDAAIRSCTWYGPDGAGGVTNGTAEAAGGQETFRLTGLTPGLRVIVVSNGTGRIVRAIAVKPGVDAQRIGVSE